MKLSVDSKSLSLTLFITSILAFNWYKKQWKSRKDKSKAAMKESKMNNSVKPYERHVVICYGNSAVWSKSIDDVESSFAALLGAALKIPRFMGTKVSGCIVDDLEEDNDDDRRLILFPDNIIFTGVQKNSIDLFITEMLQNNIKSFDTMFYANFL